MSSSIIVKLISDNSGYPDLQIQSTDTNALILGRNEQTKIKSSRCARQQGTGSSGSRISILLSLRSDVGDSSCN